MALRSVEQYRNSLRDGRTVFFRGAKVADVNTHPVIGLAVEHACTDYRMAEDPK
jgi:4-hydroxybutyryl-CoA dehydratase / vinylacetyl-CoA-Delta-isomerase